MRCIIVLLSVLTIIVGCAAGSKYNVTIDSICSPDTSTKKIYVLLPIAKDVGPNDLQFREFSSYVERALHSAGFVKAVNLNDANIAIFLNYGIGDPQDHQYSYSLPVLGQTGVSSSTTLGSYRNYGTYQGTTAYTPTYGVTGFTTNVGSYTTFFRFIILDALDLEEFKRSEKVVQLWKTTMTSIGSSGDLRKVFPVLVAASRPYIGTNTGSQVDLTLDEENMAVLEIKGLSK